MGRRGKTKSSAASAAFEQEVGGESAVDTPSQTQPRKRGRPKKSVVQKTQQTQEEEEAEAEEKPEEEAAAKEFSGKLAGESSSARAERPGDGDDDSVPYSKTKPKIVKREGTSRRKSEPRRAAE